MKRIPNQHCTKEIYDMYKENKVTGKIVSEDEIVPTVLKTKDK